MRDHALGVLVLVMTSACAAAPPAATLVSVGDRTIELQRVRPDAPRATVVFENGSRETLDTWSAVEAGLPTDVSYLAYNRAGVGRSEAINTARDGHAIVQELRALLLAQGLKPPYVLVGHSLGGLYVQLFAREHPDEVRGVVLVDSVYPGIIKRPEEFPLYTRIGKALFVSGAAAAEIDQIHATGDEVLALPSPDALPIVQLFNVPKSAGAIAIDFGVVNDDPATLARVKALYPTAHKVTVDSDHRIQSANPEVVVRAIQEVMDRVR